MAEIEQMPYRVRISLSVWQILELSIATIQVCIEAKDFRYFSVLLSNRFVRFFAGNDMNIGDRPADLPRTSPPC